MCRNAHVPSGSSFFVFFWYILCHLLRAVILHCLHTSETSISTQRERWIIHIPSNMFLVIFIRKDAAVHTVLCKHTPHQLIFSFTAFPCILKNLECYKLFQVQRKSDTSACLRLCHDKKIGTSRSRGQTSESLKSRNSAGTQTGSLSLNLCILPHIAEKSLGLSSIR